MSDNGLGLIVILFFFGLSGGFIGRMKGSGFTVWFLISFCVPFVGLLTAVLWRRDSDELRRECPRCFRIVMLHDAVCMHCGSELAFPDVAIAPRARIGRSVAAGEGELPA
jgi:hypothetical protein